VNCASSTGNGLGFISRTNGVAGLIRPLVCPATDCGGALGESLPGTGSNGLREKRCRALWIPYGKA